MPPLIITIIGFVQIAIKAAPTIVKVYEDGKQLFASLFNSGLITKAQQDELMAWADAHMNATLAGQVPPELQVEP